MFDLPKQKQVDELILIGRVIDIDGPRLWFYRFSKTMSRSQRFQAYPKMNFYLGDRFQTDKDTQAVLAFDAGGRAGIGRMSLVEVISFRKLKAVSNPMRIDVPNFWSKFDKQDDELRIYTSGGALGPEG